MPDAARTRVRRRLAAILVAGYRRLLPGDEADRIAQLRAVLTEIIQPLVSEYGGNLFKQAGDLALSEFESVVEATRCAAALRDAIVEKNQTLLPRGNQGERAYCLTGECYPASSRCLIEMLPLPHAPRH